MRILRFFLAFVLVCIATMSAAIAQVDTSHIAPVVSATHPGLAAYVGAVLATYEIVIRFIPTSKTLTIIGNILKGALYLSNYFDKGVLTKK